MPHWKYEVLFSASTVPLDEKFDASTYLSATFFSIPAVNETMFGTNDDELKVYTKTQHVKFPMTI